MIQNIAIIGGDLRMVKLAQILAKDKFNINTYALENSDELKNIEQIKICESIKQATENTELILGPIPLSTNSIEINTPFNEKKITIKEFIDNVKGKKIIAGSIKKELKYLFEENNIKIVNILEREELVVLNTIATAEGALQIAITETIKTIHGSNVLILGFGRVGKTVANVFKAMNANIYCEARKNKDFAWIKTYGYEVVKLEELNKQLNKFDIIINTIPTMIIEKEQIECIRKDCLIIDLASKPGGVNMKETEKAGIKSILALSIPGKIAPLTSAEFIKDTLYNILKEEK